MSIEVIDAWDDDRIAVSISHTTLLQLVREQAEDSEDFRQQLREAVEFDGEYFIYHKGEYSFGANQFAPADKFAIGISPSILLAAVRELACFVRSRTGNGADYETLKELHKIANG